MNSFTFLYIFLASFLIGQEVIEQEDGYFGGWPINEDKDKINDPGFIFDCDKEAPKKNIGCECSNEDDCYSGICFNSPRVGKYCLQGEGTIFPRYKLMDQYGEVVDIYDFAGHNKMIIVEFSTSWCQPCRDFSAWLAFDDMDVISHQFWKEEYAIIKRLIKEEKVYFINIQIQDKYKNPSSLASVEDWVYDYPDETIPVFSDSNYEVRNWARITAYPTMIVLNDKMEIVKFSIRGWQDALKFISSMDWNLDHPDQLNKKGNSK